MLRAIESGTLGRSQLGWLDSHFHFSFAEYLNPDNINFGVLRVWNDDIVLPGQGFDTHPHKNMEIISYVVEGSLSHKDSMGNEQTLTRGQVQYMSAGTGVLHSEYNHGTEPLRFFQIWIFADENGYPPNYGDFSFAWDARINHWLPLASGFGNERSEAPIRIHQDINAYATLLTSGTSLSFEVAADRQAYLVVAEGKARINGIGLHARDGLEIVSENIEVSALEDAHIVLIEMPFDAGVKN
ncbi:MAG: pirin family protein [Coriobacteriales bacterium]|jgi:redox-sensitive bicupin YhaK (pirin superfamily)|nr:pirin family protein [Coriobacteriales bacterium]